MIGTEVDRTCQEMTVLVTEYLNRGLPAEVRATLEQHVFTCPACTVYLAQMKTLVSLAGALGDEALPPPAATAKLLPVFERWKQR